MTIDVSDRDLTTAAGWEAFIAALCDEELIRPINTTDIADTALVLTRDPMTGAPFPCPMIEVMATVFSSSAEKDTYAILVRAMAVAGGAIASVFRSEAWLSSRDPKDGKMPRDDPDRRHAVVIIASHRDFGHRVLSADVSRDGGRRVLGEWQTLDSKGMAGRLGSFLPRPDMIDSVNMVNLARVLLAGHASQIHDLGRVGEDVGAARA